LGWGKNRINQIEKNKNDIIFWREKNVLKKKKFAFLCFKFEGRITAVRDVGGINRRLGVSGGISHSIKIVIMLVFLFFVGAMVWRDKKSNQICPKKSEEKWNAEKQFKI